MTAKPKINDTINKRVEQFVALRDKLKQLTIEFETNVKGPIATVMQRIEGELQAFMDDNGIDSVKTSKGTCYQATKYSVSLADSQAFMDYVISNNKFELLDRKANVTAVRSFLEESKTLPPGVNLSTLRTVNVRRGQATGSKENE